MSAALEIIIPVRNPGPELEQTVASLASQTDRDFSVLLSDNSSTTGLEHLKAALEKLSATSIPAKSLKPPFELRRIEHWNWAHAQSQAEWLKPLPPGGRLKPEYVSRLKQQMDRQPKAHLVRCELETEPADLQSQADSRSPFQQASLTAAEFLDYFPAKMSWIASPLNMAYRRAAWLAAGGFSPQLPACAGLNLNVTLALHYGLENLPEPLVAWTAAPVLNADDAERVNFPLELWLILRQARNYCVAAKLPWTRKRLLFAAFAAARESRRVHPYGR